MTSIDAITLEVADVSAAEAFYADAFGPVADRLRFRKAEELSSGFRGYTLSIIVAQPADADLHLDAAIGAGATVLKPASKSLWGYGGSVQAPDGAIWNVASSKKKDKGPATTDVEDVVLLIGPEDVGAAKKFYVEQGLEAGKSFGKYVEFEAPAGSAVKFGLNARKALAKSVGVSPEGSGSHRIVVHSAAGPFTDPDGFVWETS